MSSFSCIVIGEGNASLTCLHHLRKSGFEVKTVFSNTPTVQSFCEQNFIEIFPRRTPIQSVVKSKSFDYLFSVNNPTILSAAVLLLARELSINYHDSPLPSYAGVHATSWAIMKGEKQHGVSWHIIEPGIDTGDILQSQTVEVDPFDSALSLNMKCFEAAVISFRRLISDIQTSAVHHSRQDFRSRSYYGLYEIPPHLGILDFNQGLEKTYNLARALEFGTHDNRLGSPKIQTPSGKFLLVTNVKIHDDIPNGFGISSVDAIPGSILLVQENSLLVTAEPGILSLTLSELDGRQLTRGKLINYSLEAGVQLTTPREPVNEFMSLLPKKEQFWRQKMKSYEPTTLFIQKLKGEVDALANGVQDIRTVNIPLPELLHLDAEWKFDDFLAASFIAFVARASCASSVHIGLVANTQEVTPATIPLYADICPGIFNCDLSTSVKGAIDQIVKNLNRHREAKTFLLDMLYRYPELRQIKRTPHHNLVLGFEEDELNDQRLKSVLSDSSFLVMMTQKHVSISYFERSDNTHQHMIDVLKHFPTFLMSLMSGNSAKNILDINLLSPEESETLYKIPDTRADEQCADIISLFREVCKSQNDRIALKTTDTEITYFQLLEEVCSLANLISWNLPEPYRTDLRCMALYMTNSITYIISVLSAVMCSNPFMPLPVNTPLERMAFMLRDSRTAVVLTTEEALKSGKLQQLCSKLDVLFDVQSRFAHLVMLHLEMNEVDKAPPQSGANNLPEVFSFTSLSDMDEECSDDIVLEPDCCYVMYTSGSTGKPKGVQVKVPGVINMAQAQIDQWDITETDTIAQFASIGFDATISEIFTACLSGACLAVILENERLGKEFTDAVRNLGITLITLPPSVLNIYGPNDFPSLQKIVTAGEACTFSTAVRWTKNTALRFFNAYGPTETTVCASIYEYRFGKSSDTHSAELPIGKAIDGVQMYLFDDFAKPVPPGVVGEIYIGGQGLSAGYIGHAINKNQERFIQSPLDLQSKLYKTGDHAIQDKNGCLTYIGRLDDQVKIRGQRIDLNEIEQIILQHPKVDMAVVVKHQSKASPDAHIAAFVAPTLVFPSELREYLATALPCFMIPTYIKKMNARDFPFTLNGKIDRKKLQRDQSVVDQPSNNTSSHLSPIQLSMAKLWCKVLNIDENYAFNMHKFSSFSEFGGNSLHMVLLQRAIEEEFETLLSFTEIGGASSIEDFADLISLRERSSSLPNEGASQIEVQRQLINDSILNMKGLAPLINVSSTKAQTDELKNILLSGATGFLGAFLLYEILEQSNAVVSCMVRESTEPKGLDRIVGNMKKYNLWKADFKSRIVVILSDISKPNLGISPTLYKSLSVTMDVVFMNAAKMNFNTDYSDHKTANVDGTYEFIKLALVGRKKFLFATSSLAVFLFPLSPTAQQKKKSDHSDHLSSTNLINTGKMGNCEPVSSTENHIDHVKDLMIFKNGHGVLKQSKGLEHNRNGLSDILFRNNHFNEIEEKTSLLDLAIEKPRRCNKDDLAFTTSQVSKESTDNVKKRTVYGEIEEIQDPSHLIGGYGQSKWVSEKLVFQALNYLPGGAIFRPARVSGHSQSGVGPTNDLFACLLKGIHELGFAPDIDFPFDLTPVDFCAMGMVEIMIQMCRVEKAKMPRVYHFFNSSTIPFLDLFDGSSVKRLPLEQWREKVAKADRENPLVPLLPFILSTFWDRSPDWPIFSTNNTDRFISLECKKRQLHSQALLDVYKNYFGSKFPS